MNSDQAKELKFNRFVDILAVFLCLGGFFIWSALLTIKFTYFGYYDWDLDLYAQTMWNLCHGSAFVSLFGTHFLANHANYIAFLLTPIYYLFPHPLTLIHLKLFSFFGGVFIFYRIGKEVLQPLLAILLACLYILHPPNIFMLLFEFDFESLSIGLLFLLFYFFQKEKFIPFFVTACLVSLCKENLPLVVATFGIYGFFARKKAPWKWGIGPFLLGIGLFIFTMFILIPFLRKDFPTGGNIYLPRYTGLLSDPSQIFQRLFNKQNLFYLQDLFGPGIVLSWLSPKILFLSSALFIQNLLTTYSSQKTIFFHYSGAVVPFIFLAMAFSLKALRKKLRPFFLNAIVGIILIFSLVNFLRFYPLWLDRIQNWKDSLDPIRSYFVQKIPRESSVVTTFEFLDQLSQRKNVHALFNVWRDINYFTGQKPFILPSHTEYALIDFGDPWMWGDLEANPAEVSLHLREFLNKNWSIQEAVDTIVLFKKNSSQGRALVEISQTPFPTTQNYSSLVIHKDIELTSLEIGKRTKGPLAVVPITFYWKAKNNITDRYLVEITLVRDNQQIRLKSHPIGYSLYPTQIWQKDDYVKEIYFYLLPPLNSGKYNIVVSVWNASKNIPAEQGVMIGTLNIQSFD